MLVINSRFWIPIVAFASLGGLAGYLTDTYSPGMLPPYATVAGILLGGALGLSIALYLQQQKRRWIVGALLVVVISASYGTGGIWDAMLALATVGITFFISSAILKDLYGGNDIEAFQHHLRILFAARGGLVIVEKGKITLPSEKGLILGPRRIIVKPGNIVVMESGSKITRICGPSIFQSKNFEYIREVYDVSRERKSITLQNLLTEDLVPITIELTYVYGIALSTQTMRGENGSLSHKDGSQGLTQSEMESLRNLITTVPRWQQYVHDVFSGAAREVVGATTLRNLTALGDYGTTANRIQDKARRRLTILGIRIDATRLIRVVPAPQILDAYEDAERVKIRELAGGEAWRLAMNAIAAGYKKATGRLMTPTDVHHETQRFMMEHISHDKATKIVMASEARNGSDIQTPGAIIDGMIDEPSD